MDNCPVQHCVEECKDKLSTQKGGVQLYLIVPLLNEMQSVYNATVYM